MIYLWNPELDINGLIHQTERQNADAKLTLWTNGESNDAGHLLFSSVEIKVFYFSTSQKHVKSLLL
jgi:hypothetical protein